MHKEINGHKIYLRDGVSNIKQLKPIYRSDNVKRYDFHQMRSVFQVSLGFNTRGCENELSKLGFQIPYNKSRNNSLEYCDFWHYQIDAVFRGTVRNDQKNSIYVGTKDGINLKKLKVKPNDWQLFMLNHWNKLFQHLADKNGWIKIEMWW